MDRNFDSLFFFPSDFAWDFRRECNAGRLQLYQARSKACRQTGKNCDSLAHTAGLTHLNTRSANVRSISLFPLCPFSPAFIRRERGKSEN